MSTYEIVVIENNPQSVNGKARALWTEIFYDQEEAESYLRMIDKQENEFIERTGCSVLYTAICLVYVDKTLAIPAVDMEEYDD